jgi:quercetin dioxygenase-like cupin family protein
MKTSTPLLRGVCAAVVLSLAASASAMPDNTGGMSGAVLHQPDKLAWKDGPASFEKGSQFVVLEGDPAKEGPFVMRVKLPGGFQIRPHTHPKVERVTILAGTFHLAMGENLNRSHATALKTGSYGYWQPGMVHTAWADGETIVQLHGIGPWIINYVNPADDPRLRK